MRGRCLLLFVEHVKVNSVKGGVELGFWLFLILLGG